MAAALKLIASHGDAVAEQQITTTVVDAWAAATADKRRVAELRAMLVEPLVERVAEGRSQVLVLKTFAARMEAGDLTATERACIDQLGRGLSLPNIKRWFNDFRAGGRTALLPKHTGRQRVQQGWELRAMALFDRPSKPTYAAVAGQLRAEGYTEVSDKAVARYLQALPTTLGGQHSPARVGRHLHRLTRKTFQRRHLDEILVGEIYAGDGHTVDCYMRHPNTSGLFRPELTAFIDVKSKYLAGWYFTESETKESTLFALSSALVKHDHVPAWLYVDHGAGYRAKMLSDENTGWFQKFDIATIAAIPGNPHGKGWIERFFRTVRDHHDKFFAEGLMYCGDDMAPEINRRLSADIKAGKRTLPSFDSYVESFAAFIDRYHNTPMKTLDGKTPAQVWSEGLKRVPVGSSMDAVLRPRVERVVRRQMVQLHSRTYFAEQLIDHDGHAVVVEYDLHNDQTVWVRDNKDRFICTASKTASISPIPTSRLEEQRDRRLKGQEKRLENHLAEMRARREDAITVADQVKALTDLSNEQELMDLAPRQTTKALQPIARSSGADDDFDIDLTAWRDE